MTSGLRAIAPTLLAPLDGSPAAEAILPAIGVLAHAHAGRGRAPARHRAARPAACAWRAASERTRPRPSAYLRRVAARLAARGIAATWHVHMVPVGDMPRSIAAHAAEHGAALIMLSVHGTGSPRSW